MRPLVSDDVAFHDGGGVDLAQKEHTIVNERSARWEPVAFTCAPLLATAVIVTSIVNVCRFENGQPNAWSTCCPLADA